MKLSSSIYSPALFIRHVWLSSFSTPSLHLICTSPYFWMIMGLFLHQLTIPPSSPPEKSSWSYFLHRPITPSCWEYLTLLKILRGGRTGIFTGLLLAHQDMVVLLALLCSRASFNNSWTLDNKAGGRAALHSHCLSQDVCVSLQAHSWCVWTVAWREWDRLWGRWKQTTWPGVVVRTHWLVLLHRERLQKRGTKRIAERWEWSVLAVQGDEWRLVWLT